MYANKKQNIPQPKLPQKRPLSFQKFADSLHDKHTPPAKRLKVNQAPYIATGNVTSKPLETTTKPVIEFSQFVTLPKATQKSPTQSRSSTKPVEPAPQSQSTPTATKTKKKKRVLKVNEDTNGVAELKAKTAIASATKTKDLIWFNKLISDFAKKRQLRFALDAYTALLETSGVAPNVITFTSLMNACARCSEAGIPKFLQI